jgi:hypothetical protein
VATGFNHFDIVPTILVGTSSRQNFARSRGTVFAGIDVLLPVFAADLTSLTHPPN